MSRLETSSERDFLRDEDTRFVVTATGQQTHCQNIGLPSIKAISQQNWRICVYGIIWRLTPRGYSKNSLL